MLRYLLSITKAPSFLLSPEIIGTELNCLDSISSLGCPGRKGDFLSISIRGPNAIGYSNIIYIKRNEHDSGDNIF